MIPATQMIAAQKARQIEEAQRPFGSEFVAFLKKSKPEIVNIIFAFVCVLLAYQIHGMRAGIKKLLAAQEEKNAEIDRLRGLLAMLSEEENKNGDNDESEQVENQSDTFSMRLADKCVSVVRRIFAESEQRVGYSWILGRKIASGDAMEVERLLDELQPIVLSEIQSVVGDAAYTPDELKERRVAALKEQSVDALESLGSSQDVNKHSAQLSGLMEVLEEVHKADLSDEGDLTTGDALVEDGSATSAKVKRTRYAI